MTTRFLLPASALGLLFVAAACTSETEPGTGCNDAGAAAAVTATGSSTFNPAAVTVQAGETVCWQNDGVEAHTVTSNDGTTFGVTLGTRTTYQHTFAAPGTYPYHCEFHSNMTGTVTVE
jgi:plastocyanin